MKRIARWGVYPQQRVFLTLAPLMFVTSIGFAGAYYSWNNRIHIGSSISQTLCAKIEEGMTRNQVVDLIGGSSGAYNTAPVVFKSPDLKLWDTVIINRYEPEIWTGDEGEIIICFDENGIVRHCFFRSVVTDRRNLFERILGISF